MVEGVLLLLLSCGLVAYAFSAISLGVARMWLEHSLYFALQCELSARRDCRENFKQKARLLGWGEVETVSLTSRRSARQYKISTGDVTWCNEKKIVWPSENERSSSCPNEKKLKLKMQIKEKKLAALQMSQF